MRRRGKAIVIVLCLLSCLIIPFKQCHASNWLFVAVDATDLSKKYYIDTDSIQINKNRSIIKVWTKTTQSDGVKKVSLMLFNYKERFFQGLALNVYYHNGKVESTDSPDKIRYIPPDSVLELIFNKLLKITGLK